MNITFYFFRSPTFTIFFTIIIWTYSFENCIKVFTLTHTEIYVYFSIKTYFFYFIQLFFKDTNVKLSILHYILLKYYFFYQFFITLWNPLSLSLSLYIYIYMKNKKLKIDLHVNGNSVKIHGYCSNNVNIHVYKLIDVNSFCT